MDGEPGSMLRPINPASGNVKASAMATKVLSEGSYFPSSMRRIVSSLTPVNSASCACVRRALSLACLTSRPSSFGSMPAIRPTNTAERRRTSTNALTKPHIRGQSADASVASAPLQQSKTAATLRDMVSLESEVSGVWDAQCWLCAE
jgi:hypothetical protein